MNNESKMNNINKSKDAITSLMYLILIILKQKWKLVITLLLLSILLIPAPQLFGLMLEDFKLASGLVAGFAIFPSLLILLVLLPIIWNEISTSSIEKRMNSSGIGKFYYSFVVMIIFTLLALVIYYFMLIITSIIFVGKEFKFDGYYGAVEEWTQTKWMFFNFDIKWFTLLVLTPISMFGLSAAGVLISKIKIEPSFKLILVFLGIIYLLVFSRTLLSPLDFISRNDFDTSNNAYINNGHVQKLRFLDSLLLLTSPLGSMVYTIQYGMLGDMLTSNPATREAAEIWTWYHQMLPDNDGVLVEYTIYVKSIDMDKLVPILNPIPTFIYSILWTTILTFIALFLPSLRENNWNVKSIFTTYGVDNSSKINNDELLIKIDNLDTIFKDRKGYNHVHTDLSLEIKKGEFLSLIGVNGVGKTVLAETIVGLRKVQSGKIKYADNFNIYEDSSIQFQIEDNTSELITPRNLIRFYTFLFRRKTTKEEVEELIATFDLNKFIDKKVSKLSGGQRQRLNLMLSMINKPKLLILDEFTAGLDIVSSNKIIKYIVEFLKENNSTLIVITHSGKEVKLLANRVVLLSDGKITLDTSVDKVMKEYDNDFDKFMLDKLGEEEFKGINEPTEDDK